MTQTPGATRSAPPTAPDLRGESASSAAAGRVLAQPGARSRGPAESAVHRRAAREGWCGSRAAEKVGAGTWPQRLSLKQVFLTSELGPLAGRSGERGFAGARPAFPRLRWREPGLLSPARLAGVSGSPAFSVPRPGSQPWAKAKGKGLGKQAAGVGSEN